MTTATAITHRTASGYTGAVPSKKPFLSFVIDEELLKAIDDFRFENRYPSRAAAIMALLRRGLQARAGDVAGDASAAGGRSRTR